MKTALLALASIALLPQITPDPSVAIIRTDFEQGVDYGVNWIEPVASADVKCVIENWKKAINWDYPGGRFEDLLQPPPGGKLYSRKVFSEPGVHKAVAKLWIHCKDAPGEWTHVVDSLPPKTIHIWRRVPLQKAEFPTSSLKGGQPASLRLVLSAAAPASGTRVHLTSSNKDLVPLTGLAVDDKGSFVVVPARASETSVQLQTKAVTAARTVNVSAATTSTVTTTLQLIP